MPARLGIEIIHRANGGESITLVAPPHITSRPIALGSRAEVVIKGEGIAPEHLFAIVRDGRLLLTVAQDNGEAHRAPVMVSRGATELSTLHGGAPDQTALPVAKWVAVELPCKLQIGETILRLAWCARRVITPPPSAMLEPVTLPFGEPASASVHGLEPITIPFGAMTAKRSESYTGPSCATPDSEPTTQKRPRMAPTPRRLLPPLTPPPRRPSPTPVPSRSSPSPSSVRDSVPTLSSPNTHAAAGSGSEPRVRNENQREEALLSAPTIRTPLPIAPRTSVLAGAMAHDVVRAPPSSPTPNDPPPSHPTLVQPLAPDVPQGIPRIRVPTRPPLQRNAVGYGHGSLPPLASPPMPPHERPRQSEAFLFQMASRAVDAWNRFVDDVDKKTSRAR